MGTGPIIGDTLPTDTQTYSYHISKLDETRFLSFIYKSKRALKVENHTVHWIN